MLHFTITELFWECKDKIVCESFPEKLPDYKGPNRPFYNPRRQLLYNGWGKIVALYSSAGLTYSKDKLVALSGLARAAKYECSHTEVDDDYVAGMWRRDLETQLLWQAMPPLKTRASPYRAPSWSWTSVDGRIHCFLPDHRSQCMERQVRVLEIDITLAGVDPFGQVSRGVLKLGIKYMLLVKQTGRKLHISHSGTTLEFTAMLDTLEEKVEDRVIYMIPIMERIDGFSGLPSSWRGIIVCPTGNEPGQCSRVGVFTIFGKKLSNSFYKAIGEIGPATARDRCAEIVNDIEESFVFNLV